MAMMSLVLNLHAIDVVISLQTAGDPRKEDWAVYIGHHRALRAAASGSVERIRNLIVSDGGAPSSAQRSEIIQTFFGGRPTPVAVITHSLSNPVKRGIVTVISWMNSSFRAYLPDAAPEALAHVGCAVAEEQIFHALVQLQKELPKNRSLAEMAARLGRPRPRAFVLAKASS